MKNATLADIVTAGQAAANLAFPAEHMVERQKIKIAQWDASGFDTLDFPNFQDAFNAQIEMLDNFSRQDSVATVAAKKAAAHSPQPTA